MSSRLTLRDLSLALALIALAVYFTVAVPGWKFLSALNLSQLTIDFSIAATLAIGMLLVILPGHIDLSAGSGVGLIGGIGAVLITNHHWPALPSLAVGLVVALIIWGAMGTLIVKERIPAFIITLGGLLLYRGLFLDVIQHHTIPIVPGGQHNLYSLLTTYYLPPIAGYTLAGIAAVGIIFFRLQSRAARQQHGLPTDDMEITFLQLFLAAQIIFLFVLVTHAGREGEDGQTVMAVNVDAHFAA